MALNYFIFKGLWSTEIISSQQHAKARVLGEGFLADNENQFGSTHVARALAYLVMTLSLVSTCANIAGAGVMWEFNHNPDVKILNKGWLFTLLTLSNAANLYGFVLLKVLGKPNAGFLAAITHQELDKKDKEIKKFTKDNHDLRAQLNVQPSADSPGSRSPGAGMGLSPNSLLQAQQ